MTKSLEKTKEPKLTVKQSAFLEQYLDPNSPTYGNGTATALAVYDTDNRVSAASIAYQNFTKLQNRKEVLLELRNLGFNRLMTTADEGLEATKTTNASILVTKDGKTERAEEQGLIEVNDYATRHKYMVSVGKWLGLEEEKKKETNVFIDKLYVELPPRKVIDGVIEGSDAK